MTRNWVEAPREEEEVRVVEPLCLLMVDCSRMNSFYNSVFSHSEQTKEDTGICIFNANDIEHKMCVLIFSTTFV